MVTASSSSSFYYYCGKDSLTKAPFNHHAHFNTHVNTMAMSSSTIKNENNGRPNATTMFVGFHFSR